MVPPLAGPILPAPTRPDGPPVWLGGRSDEVVRIAGSLADGWNGWGLDEPSFRRKAELLAEEGAQRSRRRGDVGGHLARWCGRRRDGGDARGAAAAGMPEPAWQGSAEGFADHLRGLATAGATWAIVVLAGRPGAAN